MTETEKQLTEQIAAVTTASAEMTSRLLMRLINLKKITPGEGVLILGDLVGHNRDIAQRNEHISGYPVVFRTIADRLQLHKEALEKETGAKVEIVRSPKP